MPRSLSIDLAKGFTVLFIPAIHIAMLYADQNVHQSFFSLPFKLIAEWPGAQLLMFLMGMSFSFSKRSTVYHIKRALLILVTGYLLNVFKFLFLRWLGWLPSNFIHDLNFSHQHSSALNLFLIGDILQFAGLALLVHCLLRALKYESLFAVFLSYIIIVASPLFWDWHHPNIIVDHFLHLLGGSTPDTFFPLNPWLIYPLIGLAIGNYCRSEYRSLKAIFFSGAFLFLSGFCMQFSPFHFPATLFWRTYPDKTIMHLGFVLVWISFWFWLEPYLKAFENSFIIKLLSFCSRNITTIYLLQWIIIFWMLPLFGYNNLDLGETIITIPFIYILVFVPSYFISKKTNRKRKSKPPPTNNLYAVHSTTHRTLFRGSEKH